MLSVLPSIVALAPVALISILLVRSRPSPDNNIAGRQAASRVLSLAVLVQCVHFAEEAATGFHVKFPALFGFPPMPFSLFLVFNLAWIGIWIAAIPGLRANRPAALFAAWFLAIAGVLNGIAHPFMATSVGAYFPGLLSSPLLGFACLWLWRHLLDATGPTPSA